MSSSNSNVSSGGIGILGFMFLIFLTLKLCKVITWSWWWVTAPLWMPFSVVVAFLLVVLAIFCIAKVLGG